MKSLILLSILMGVCCVYAMPDIHFHAKDGRLEQVKQLLSEDPNLINAKEQWGATPLHWAVRTGRTEVVHFLVEQGADLQAKDQFGRTCLHVAAENNRSGLITFLVAKGADIEDQNQYGDTPLHEAARCHSVQAILILLELGANKEAKTNSGHIPLEKAISSREYYADLLQKQPEREDLEKGIKLYDQSISILKGISNESSNDTIESSISVLWKKEIELSGRSIKPWTIQVADNLVRIIGLSHIPRGKDPKLVEYRINLNGNTSELKELLSMNDEDITLLLPETSIKDVRLIGGNIIIIRNPFKTYNLQELTINRDWQAKTRDIPGLTRSSVSTHDACRNQKGDFFLCGNNGYIRKVSSDGNVAWDTNYKSDKGEDGTLGVAYSESENVLVAFGMSFEPDTKFTSKNSSLWLGNLDTEGNFKTQTEFEGICNFGKNPSFCLSQSDHPIVFYDIESELKNYNIVLSKFTKDLKNIVWTTPLFKKKDVMVSRMSLIPCGENHILAAFLCMSLNQHGVNPYFYILDDNGKITNHMAFENMSCAGLLLAVDQDKIYLVTEDRRDESDPPIEFLKLTCFKINDIAH